MKYFWYIPIHLKWVKEKWEKYLRIKSIMIFLTMIHAKDIVQKFSYRLLQANSKLHIIFDAQML